MSGLAPPDGLHLLQDALFARTVLINGRQSQRCVVHSHDGNRGFQGIYGRHFRKRMSPGGPKVASKLDWEASDPRTVGGVIKVHLALPCPTRRDRAHTGITHLT